ncbi:MAG: M23 family metallopeptidase [Evtepia sp.]
MEKKKKKSDILAERRLLQLLVCMMLFLLVFAGKRLDAGFIGTLDTFLHTNTDFKSTFLRVGAAVSEGEPIVETFRTLYAGVFAPALPRDTADTPPTTTDNTPPPVAALPQEPPASAVPPPPPISATTTPVMGVLTSPFGYRTHPVDGTWKCHNGVDLMANTGSDILAYADGTVAFIGESDIYGLYVQLQHADSLTTFYAHCSKLNVQDGQRVTCGEKIAEVGESGQATGPHLHFEMKKDGTRIDPLPYIKTLS